MVTEELLLSEGILTKEKIRKYPLRLSSLRYVQKIYAVIHNEPFTYTVYRCKGIASEYYLTEQGLSMVINFLKGKDVTYLRSIIQHMFINATQGDVDDIETFGGMANFYGTKGAKLETIPNKAFILRKVNRATRRYDFDSVKEARKYLPILLADAVIEDLSLYKIRRQGKYWVNERQPLLGKQYVWNGKSVKERWKHK